MDPITQDIDEDIESLFSQSAISDKKSRVYLRYNLRHELKFRYRLCRKKVSAFIRDKMKRNFKQILYVTLFKPPEDYILSFKKQYPDKEIVVILPIIGEPKGLIKTSVFFDFCTHNHKHMAHVYKFPRNKNNITIYGMYSHIFSNILSKEQFNDIKSLSAYMKCVRIFAKKLGCDIVHSDKIPYFLGAEFENNLKHTPKVFQTVEEIVRSSDMYEPFWAFINIADKKAMKKMYKDKIVQKCIASLFKRNAADNSYNINECLNFIYDNYLNFRTTIDKTEEITENALFERLNARILKLFPQIFPKDGNLYNPMFYTLKKADFWAVTSKTYYKNIYEHPELIKGFEDILKQSEGKSNYVQYGYNFIPKTIHKNYDTESFRTKRKENKKYILKEFSKDRIITKFIDKTLFEGECEIHGYFDSFYEAPLIFTSFCPNVTEEGIDIAIYTILKLFELNKNIQVIFNIPNGMKNKYIKSFVNFCEDSSALNGRWIFLDGKINLPQFLAASDLILLPARKNAGNFLHIEAMKYGCIPIAGRNGTYNDTISDIFDDITSGCGFKTDIGLNLSDNPNETFLKVVTKALNLYYANNSSYNIIIRNAMEYNSSWNFGMVEQFNKIYEELI